MNLFDSHAHYNDEKFDNDRKEIIEQTLKNGVSNFIVAGYNIESSKKALNIVKEYKELYSIVGISPNDIEDENVRKIYNFIISLSNEYDINKIDILSKIQDEDMVKEITDIMYIDISGYEEKLLQDVLKNKKKERLYTRRDEIIKRLTDNISKDESDILKVELNQIVIELSKLK